MGSSFPLFANKNRSDSPHFTPYSSQNLSKKPSKSQLQNRKNSYIELQSKYQLFNQRWTTIRQYQKLNSMVMRNFSKTVERGSNSKNYTTTFGIGDFENSNSDSKNRREGTKKHNNWSEERSETPKQRVETSDFKTNEILYVKQGEGNQEKISDFLDHSNQLLIGHDENFLFDCENSRNGEESYLGEQRLPGEVLEMTKKTEYESNGMMVLEMPPDTLSKE